MQYRGSDNLPEVPHKMFYSAVGPWCIWSNLDVLEPHMIREIGEISAVEGWSIVAAKLVGDAKVYQNFVNGWNDCCC